MRYYDIAILNTDGSLNIGFTSLSSDGVTPDPGALRIEVDIPLAPFHAPAGAARLKIYGVPISLLASASNFNGLTIKMKLGMSKGLPLANPNEVGSAITGTIFQCYGNWIGVNMTLDFIFYPPSGSQDTPANISQNWQANTPLSQAIAPTLQAAFPNLKQNIQISSNLVLPNNEPGIYLTLNNFAQYLNDLSKMIIKDSSYQGVSIYIANGIINVTDGTVPPTAKMVNYTDLIGQPVWLGPVTVQVMCVMRSDINVGDRVQLPQTQYTETQASTVNQARQNLTFDGTYNVTSVRLVGDSRAPSAESWVTMLTMIANATSNS